MSNITHALVVDDDNDIRELLCNYLTRFGIDAQGVGDGVAMRHALQASAFDIIVLDLMLPGEDGLSICRWLRAASNIPIIILTARGDPMERVIGLELGADDYLTKPFEPRELVARIQTVLRRSRQSASPVTQTPENKTPINDVPFGDDCVMFARWRLDRLQRQLISPKGLVVSLSNAEYRLLNVFISHPHRILTRDQLLDEARGRSIEAFDRSIDVLVSRLRQKLGEDTKEPAIIKTLRGQGYLFCTKVERCNA